MYAPDATKIIILFWTQPMDNVIARQLIISIQLIHNANYAPKPFLIVLNVLLLSIALNVFPTLSPFIL